MKCRYPLPKHLHYENMRNRLSSLCREEPTRNGDLMETAQGKVEQRGAALGTPPCPWTISPGATRFYCLWAYLSLKSSRLSDDCRHEKGHFDRHWLDAHQTIWQEEQHLVRCLEEPRKGLCRRAAPGPFKKICFLLKTSQVPTKEADQRGVGSDQRAVLMLLKKGGSWRLAARVVL